MSEDERIFYDHVDRSEWGEGPWDGEPDKVQWIDAATGLDCLVVRNHHGSWCGYVGVPPGHRFHGADYDDVDVDVHGGLTFADACDENAPEPWGICHVPFEGRPADVWWLGFDCGHFLDVSPGIDALLRKVRRERPDPKLDAMEARVKEMGERTGIHDHYWTLGEARAETEHLALQLA